jgi:hypothetical protein
MVWSPLFPGPMVYASSAWEGVGFDRQSSLTPTPRSCSLGPCTHVIKQTTLTRSELNVGGKTKFNTRQRGYEPRAPASGNAGFLSRSGVRPLLSR